MAQNRVSPRYAKSLFDLATERNQIAAVKADVELIRDTLDASRELDKVLESPIINSGKKSAILKGVFSNKLNTTTLEFIDIVINKKREGLLQEIVADFLNIYNKMNGIEQVEVTTAIPLTPASRAEIQKQIEQYSKKQITLVSKVDPSIIGGLIIRFEDSLYDKSISHQLNTIKKELLNSYISKN